MINKFIVVLILLAALVACGPSDGEGDHQGDGAADKVNGTNKAPCVAPPNEDTHSTSPNLLAFLGFLVTLPVLGIIFACLCCSGARRLFCRCCQRVEAPATSSPPAAAVSAEERGRRICESLSTAVAGDLAPVTKCRGGHDLAFVPLAGNRCAWVQCSSCGRPALDQGAVWQCVPCSFSICPRCRDARPSSALKYPACRDGHPLVWSVIHSVITSAKYTCRACAEAKDCDKGRWFCVRCGVDVCEACQERRRHGRSEEEETQPSVAGVVAMAQAESEEATKRAIREGKTSVNDSRVEQVACL